VCGAGDKEAVTAFQRNLHPLILTESAIGDRVLAAGRPKPSEVIAYWPALIPKSAVSPKVIVEST